MPTLPSGMGQKHGTKKKTHLTRRASVKAMERNYCTVNTVEPAMPPEFAPIVVGPAAMQFAAPATLGAFAIVATVACEELQ